MRDILEEMHIKREMDNASIYRLKGNTFRAYNSDFKSVDFEIPKGAEFCISCVFGVKFFDKDLKPLTGMITLDEARDGL